MKTFGLLLIFPLIAHADETMKHPISINLGQVFASAPIIYSILLSMSVATLFIWLYCFLSLRSSGNLKEALVKSLRTKIHAQEYHEALDLCMKEDTLFCKMIRSGLLARNLGTHVIIETMKSERKRASAVFWQRLSLLNDIAIIAPMLGLLGTVLGMFYAFYDLNRTIESVSSLFNGLGISVGTTVAGLIVSIIAIILYSFTKYRLVRLLTLVDNEAQSLAPLLNPNSEKEAP